MDASGRDISQAKDFIAPRGYSRHRPETTLLYELIADYYPRFRDQRAAEGRALPCYVEDEFAACLKCGLIEHGFLRVKCDACQAEKLVAFSCKRRGFCPSCGARRMAETAALLVDKVLPQQPVRQWVLSLTFALRYLLAFPGERGRITDPTTSPGCGSACIAAFNLPSTPRLQHAPNDLTESADQTKAAYTSYSQVNYPIFGLSFNLA